jgi:uncharacterized protein with beta-barrel porin domain
MKLPLYFAKKLFAPFGVTVLALSSNAAFSACDATGNSIALTSSCNDLDINAKPTDVTVGPSATISPFFSLNAATVQQTGQITGPFLNQGTITSGFGHNGLVNHGQISLLINEGAIVSVSSSANDGAIVNNNLIQTLNNKGNISATVGNWGAGAHALLMGGQIGTLNNSGTISAQNSAIYFTPGITSSIGTLINSGTIQGGINGNPSSTFASAIELGTANSIGTIINTGTIDHSVCDAGGSCYAAIYNAGGNIGTITNNGNLTSGNTGNNAYGIINTITGSINTLNNAQSNLAYFGKLPSNYNTIVNSPSAYGKLIVTSASAQLTYGVAFGSTLKNGETYAAVLNGVTASHLTNTTGIYGGGLITTQWRLNNSAGTQWDLVTESVAAVAPNTGSNSGNKLGNAISFAYAGATAASIAPTLANGTSLVTAVQSITPSQAGSLGQVHAEGYSSNMTITLQQMGHVTHTLMDRIGGQAIPHTDSSPAAELELGKSFWLDASRMNGNVKSYDNLAGFSYQLSNLIMGRDVYQDATSRVGVFGGVGYTTMTEPEQVSQNFSSTNFYAGLYGGTFVYDRVKLSASLGYLDSNTSASRHNPDIGQFTGGTAQSHYNAQGTYGAFKIARPLPLTDKLTVTPFAGISYAKLRMKSAQESEANDFNYGISAHSDMSTVTFVGSDFAIPLHQSTSRPLTLTGFYRLGYDWSADKSTAHTITANSPLFGSFSQTGANKGPVNHLMGIGLQGDFARGISLRTGIVGSVSTHGKEWGGGAEIRWAL